MEASRIVPRLLGPDALLALRAHTGRENNGRAHRPLPEDLHRAIVSHRYKSSHLSHSSAGATCLWALSAELYVNDTFKNETIYRRNVKIEYARSAVNWSSSYLS